jgi:His-Xaa-Ser system protein HxsD
MFRMRPVAEHSSETIAEFDATIQTLAALTAASYRLIGLAHCQIEKVDGRFVCHLSGRAEDAKSTDMMFIKSHFLDLVSDENLRERLAAKTEPLRNLILSLAFGSLASRPSDP